MSPKKRFRILKRDGFKCVYCGKKPGRSYLVIDHVIPRSKGGSSEDDNLVSCCQKCNQGKGNALLQEKDYWRVAINEDGHIRRFVLEIKEGDSLDAAIRSLYSRGVKIRHVTITESSKEHFDAGRPLK